MSDVDTLVIGSGAGGLTAAVALARAGEKVLVVEQHDVPGGWCHSFMLGGHHFSPGVHYLGELGPGGALRRMYEGLGVANDMVFLELNPDGYEHIRVGDRRVDLPKGRERLEAHLCREFPHEAAGIKGYLRAVDAIVRERDLAVRGSPLTLPFRAPNLVAWGLTSAGRLLRHHIDDPVARAVLSAQSGDHGLGPDEVPAVVHASVQAHYFEGGWYPQGGGAAIPRAFVKELKRHGGQLRVKTPVEKLLVEGGRVVGARLAGGEEVRAKRVVSNADPAVTYGRLLDPADVPGPIQKQLARTRWSTGCLSLFLAAELDADAMGLDSGNYWYAADADVQGAYDVARSGRLDLERFPAQFLTVTTRKDRAKGKPGVHTMESFVFVGWEPFKKWAATRYGERPADYAALKEDLTERMVRNLDAIVPGLAERVVFRELGTPLTNQHYVASTEGNLYGTEKTLRQVGPWSWRIRSPIPGLFLCGASTTSHGVMGATQSGLNAAAMALGCRRDELLTATNQELRTWPADQPSLWPEAAQERLRRKGKGLDGGEEGSPSPPPVGA